MNWRRVLVGGALLVVTLGLSGCGALLLAGAGAAAGAGAVAYAAGELKAGDEVGFERAYAAALGAMEELQFKVTRADKDALAARIVARRADDTPITVRLRALSDRLTEIRIRVGTFGDETLSRTIHDRMRRRY